MSDLPTFYVFALGRGSGPQELAGDIQLLKGNPQAALERYDAAARLWMPESLMLRRFQAFAMAGRAQDAVDLTDAYLASTPTSRQAMRLSAWLSVQAGNWERARIILEHLAATGGERDVQLLSDLAFVELQTGDIEAAEANARRAYALQRSNPVAAQTWGLSPARKSTQDDGRQSLAGRRSPAIGEQSRRLILAHHSTSAFTLGKREAAGSWCQETGKWQARLRE